MKINLRFVFLFLLLLTAGFTCQEKRVVVFNAKSTCVSQEDFKLPAKFEVDGWRVTSSSKFQNYVIPRVTAIQDGYLKGPRETQMAFKVFKEEGGCLTKIVTNLDPHSSNGLEESKAVVFELAPKILKMAGVELVERIDEGTIFALKDMEKELSQK